MRSLILIVALAASAVLVARADRFEVPAARLPFSQFPMQVGDWQGRQEPPFDDTILKILGVDDYLTRTYFDAANRAGMGVYIGYWASQRQGDTIHSPLNCMPGAGWEPESQAIVPLPFSAGGSTVKPTVNRVVIRKGIDRQLVLYWYQSHGHLIASEYWSKFHMIADAVRMNRSDGALVRLIAPIEAAGEERAEKSAFDFAKSLLPVLDRYLPL